MTGPELERALHYWPAVLIGDHNAATARFVKSIAMQSRRRGWKPTTKQWGWMQCLVDDVAPDDGELVFIE